jgi:OOP family OmpA-OmpF porin
LRFYEYVVRMSKLLFIILILSIPILGNSQSVSGLWKGSYYPNGTAPEKGIVIYLEIKQEKTGEITGKSRSEIYDTQDYALKNVKGQQKEKSISLNENTVSKKTTKIKNGSCRLQMQLTYNETTGYLEGGYSSSECKNHLGKVVLYRYEGTFPEEPINSESHHWFDLLGKDLKKGLNAPEIRKKERENFVFKPIYFDYDKSEIKPEFHPFLNKLIHVVEGHSDLRVKVTGHTDSDGSDAYNDGLSKRRAQAIIDYFVSKGLSADRLEFDFRGEKSPADTNQTPEGRQRNRRVDFQFI